MGYAHVIKHVWYSTHTLMQHLSTLSIFLPSLPPYNPSKQMKIWLCKQQQRSKEIPPSLPIIQLYHSTSYLSVVYY